MNFKNLDDFWAFYVSQHSKVLTRRLHFMGTLSGLLCLLSSLLCRRWILLLPAPIIGYALAWYSHFFVEGNVPATFGHPLWSFLCDLKMFAFMLSGRMDKEIKRLGKRPLL
ncbi:2-hydroxy-palmitic acid dioxygenase Mpo1-like protein [Dioscorea alata]|uniref:2-hydroxy-palmitic acid dioxygenase Mpo1-like protein n=1 Tax=Dioscorea alata TaxID=55571 RepID=A0ACB7V3T3_DIOAL|nr:2-hydroxy-palmitic acid dioxygenase Mpo1-like protein [Dioscorea alata]